VTQESHSSSMTTQHHTLNNQHCCVKGQKKMKIVRARASQWSTQTTTTQHHTLNNQHCCLKGQREIVKARTSQRSTQRTTDQRANCSWKTGVLLASRVKSAHISIPSNVASSFKGAEQSMDARIGSVICCTQGFARTHTSLGLATGSGAKRDTPRTINSLRKGLKITVTSLFYGRSKFRNK